LFSKTFSWLVLKNKFCGQFLVQNLRRPAVLNFKGRACEN